MTTTSYTDNNIFENKQVNAICDLLFTKLVEKFPPTPSDASNFKVYKGVILSGDGAKILNGGSVKELKNIVFECDQLDIFKYLSYNIQNILPGKSIKFQNRILAYPFDKYIEIWFKSSENKPNLQSDIFVQLTAFINPETL